MEATTAGVATLPGEPGNAGRRVLAEVPRDGGIKFGALA